jgi:predicted Zn-dependent protease
MPEPAASLDLQVAETIERALELYREKHVDHAIEIMGALAAEAPTVPPVQFYLALLLVQDGQFNGAIEPARLAVQQAPESGKASMVLYRALGGSGLHAEALEELKRYLATNPSGEYAEILRDLKTKIEVEVEKDGPCESW